jgi:LysM repeat protein
MNELGRINRTCPSLSLMDDKDTSLGFPSKWNTCQQSVPIATPRFEHQKEFCLGGKYSECPLFLSQQAMPLPHELRIPRSSSDITAKNFRRNFVIALIFFVVVLAVGWKVTSVRGEVSPVVAQATWTASSFTKPTSMAISPPTISVAVIPTLTLASGGTATSVAIPISSPSNHQLEQPIGTDIKFVIHKIVQGETLNQLAEKFDTSVEAILAVNYTKKNPGWSGTLLVIPIEFTDFARLPGFVVYQVAEKDRGTTVEKMAEYLQVDPLELKYYNGWTTDGDRPLVGEYLLVPRPRPIQ